MSESRYSVTDLLRVMERLRDPQHGCPWDLAQDFETIVPSTLEECYELAQAIEQQDFPHVAEELGDVLFQVVFYSQLGRERSLFSFDSVVHTLVEKLVRRHPHVFGGGEIEGVVPPAARSSLEDIRESWESIKQEEREAKEKSGILADVPAALPALPRAQKLQKRAARVNFDWHDATHVLDKLDEEIGELRQAMASGDSEAEEQELGDILFTCVNLARHMGIDAETCLRHSSSKFEGRFACMERLAAQEGLSMESLSAAAMDDLWERAKGEDCQS